MSRWHRFQIAPPEPPALDVGTWEPWVGPLGQLPRTRADVYDVFGNPGVGAVDRAWKRRNIVVVRDMPGIEGLRFRCHRLAEPYHREALRRATLSCPEYRFPWAGSFAFRHQRHDKDRPLSMHSWGIAIDIYPKANRSRYFPRGQGPEQFSEQWWALWPDGMPEAFVRAFQSVGFTWGADWDEDGSSLDHTYRDPMHFELRDRSKQ